MKYLFFLLAILLWTAGPVSAHNGHDHSSTSSGATVQQTVPQPDTISNAYISGHNTGTLQDFPKLHPMIVHFPIVFLILAFIIQIISFFVFKRELSWVTLFLVVLGFIGAYVATNLLHGGDPNLATLDPISRATFERHEQFAHYTIWLSGIAALIKIISHFVFKRKWWTEIIAVVLMAGAVYTITVTGDMGARLVHIDAIGVQGNKIPAEDTD